ncbi:hypothetical protein OQA88_11875 [Cercophora sp. LCS_1]
MASYPYQPINLPYETRILTVEPGSFDSPLVCSLSPMPLASPPPYTALSYCWNKSISSAAATDFSKPITGVLVGGSSEQPEHYSLPLGDALDHPHFGSFYIRSGGPLAAGTVDCDGVIGIPIGGELARALRRIRPDPDGDDDDAADGGEPVGPLRIWVDALCIDQSNVAERNAHVCLMGQIYAGADLVHVWIGEEIGVEDAAMQALGGALAVFGEVLPRSAADAGGLQDGKTFEARQAEVSLHPRFRAAEWDSLGAFVTRSWFERVWVIQEIANAKGATVHCGRYSLPWHVLGTVIQTMRDGKIDDVLRSPRAVTAISMMAEYRREKLLAAMGHPAPEPASLLDVLEEAREFDSTLASDKIYAVMGFANRNDQKRIVVDYGKTAERLFTDFAIGELGKGSIDVLTHCVWSRVPSSLVKLPSWVPDWTRSGATPPFRFRGLRCRAAGNTRVQIEMIDEQNGVLELAGRVLDTVAAVDEKAHIPWGREDALHVTAPIVVGSMQQLISEIQQPGFSSPEYRNRRRDDTDRRWMSESAANILQNIAFPDGGGGVTLEQFDAVWRAWICNRTRDNEIPGAEFGPCWAAIMSRMTGFSFWKKTSAADATLVRAIRPTQPESKVPPAGWQSISVEDATGGRETSLALMGAYSKWCYRRRFCRTVDGRFGWVVDGTQPGDLVVLFYGCHFPFVLRQTVGEADVAVGEKAFRIVGDCYIYGLMDGEGLADRFPATVFRIL